MEVDVGEDRKTGRRGRRGEEEERWCFFSLSLFLPSCVYVCVCDGGLSWKDGWGEGPLVV